MASFTRAQRGQTRVRMVLFGPKGAGKTMTALRVARSLAMGGPISVFATEPDLARYLGRACPDGGRFGFELEESPNQKRPEDYLRAIDRAERRGVSVLVLDGLTPALLGASGRVEYLDPRHVTGRWRYVRDTTPAQRALLHRLVTARVHVIATVLVKERDYEERDLDGNMQLIRGLAQPIWREELEYAFDVAGDLDHGWLHIAKTRCASLRDLLTHHAGWQVGQQLLWWVVRGGVLV